MQKLDGCVISTAVDTDTIIRQISENSKLNISNLSDCPDFREGKSIAVVGGGPSLKNYLEELRSFKGTIIACGSVHDFLVENDIAFQFCVLCDPDPLIAQYIKHLHYDIKYLIASQCHPDVFKLFKDERVGSRHYFPPDHYIWHAGGSNLENTKAFNEGENLIGGGCTVGTRAIVIAMCLGYSNISLFGFDSSLDKNFKHHSYEFQTEEETIGNITEIRLGGPDDKEVFYCAGYMIGQLFDFKKLLEVYGKQIKFDIRCDGALRRLMDLGIEMNKLNNLSTQRI